MARPAAPRNGAPCPDCSGEFDCRICGGLGVITPAQAEVIAEQEQQRADERGVWEDSFDDGGPE